MVINTCFLYNKTRLMSNFKGKKTESLSANAERDSVFRYFAYNFLAFVLI